MPMLPSGGLDVPLPQEKPRPTSTGQVLSVSSDQRTCRVDVAGTQFTATIPGSVRGVAVGRTVEVRTQGNDRVVQTVMTTIPSSAFTPSSAYKRTTMPTQQVVKPGYIPDYVRSEMSSYLPTYQRNAYPVSTIGTMENRPVTYNDINWVAGFVRQSEAALLGTYDYLDAIQTRINGQGGDIYAIGRALSAIITYLRDQAANVDVIEGLRDLTNTLLDDLQKQGVVR